MVGMSIFSAIALVAFTSQGTLESGYGNAGIIPKELVTCSSKEGAIRIAEAIADISTPNDAIDAYKVYLTEPGCSFESIMFGDYESLWRPEDPTILVFALEDLNAVRLGKTPHYIVFATRKYMAEFMACEMFLEEGSGEIEGCQTDL